MNEKPSSFEKDAPAAPNGSAPLSPNQILIEKVKAEIWRKPTPQLIVLLRALEKVQESEETVNDPS